MRLGYEFGDYTLNGFQKAWFGALDVIQREDWEQGMRIS